MYPEGIFMGVAFNPLPTVLILGNYENLFTASQPVKYCIYSSKKFFFFHFNCGKIFKRNLMFGIILAKVKHPNPTISP